MKNQHFQEKDSSIWEKNFQKFWMTLTNVKTS